MNLKKAQLLDMLIPPLPVHEAEPPYPAYDDSEDFSTSTPYTAKPELQSNSPSLRWKCSNCGHANWTLNMFGRTAYKCSSCKQVNRMVKEHCGHCPCAKCGHINKKGVRRCVKCGKAT